MTIPLQRLWQRYNFCSLGIFVFTGSLFIAMVIGYNAMSQEIINNGIIFDSRMTFAEATAGTKAPKKVIDALCLIDVSYYSFDGKLHLGQLIVHKTVRKDILDIFAWIEKTRFPVARAIPIVRYNWSDKASMADNNTSAFNYRFVQGTKRLSHHAFGRAVDINPCQNPVIYKDGRINPPGAVYRSDKAGAFSEASPIVQAFLSRRWQWGAHFKTVKDHHHFQKL
jgi:peptidoglycan L-alanyl-D-glutamate endopeptidase CwlK